MQIDDKLDLLQLARQLQDLTAATITFATLPTTGTPTITYQGTQVSIVAVDFAAIPGFIAQVVGQPTAYQSATTVSPRTVTVDVVNGTGQTGLATRNGAALQALGFQVGTPQSTDATTTTTITYPKGKEAQAKTLAADVHGAVPAFSPDATGITLVLGPDGVQVPGANPSAPTTTPTITAPTSAPTAGSTTTSATSAPATSATDANCID